MKPSHPKRRKELILSSDSDMHHIQHMKLTAFILLIISCGNIYSQAPKTGEDRIRVVKVQIFYTDPWSSTIAAVPVDELVSAASKKTELTNFIELSGGDLLSELNECFQKEIAWVPTTYWLRNTLDARVIFRLFTNENDFIQITFQDFYKYEWNNISDTALSEKKRKAILDLIPNPLMRRYESLLKLASPKGKIKRKIK